jgi:hypothetical protein
MSPASFYIREAHPQTSRIVALAFADRRHLVCDTAKTERDLCRARLALRRAREAARNEFPA